MAKRDLRTTMTDQVLETIQGFDSSTDSLMFNNYGDKDNMTRTTDNWMHALVGSTGIPALNNRTYAGYVDGAIIGGVLITPRHLMTSRHAAGQVGNIFHFWDREDNVYTRTATGAASAGSAYSFSYGDFVILTLDSDLPAAIEPVKVFPPNLYTYLDPSLITGTTNSYTPSDETLIVSTDQEEKSLVHRITNLRFGFEMLEDSSPDSFVQPGTTSDGIVYYSSPTDTEALGWRESMIGGDSGSPFFAVIDDELVLLGVAMTSASLHGLINYRVQNDINLMIENADTSAGVDTGYELTTYDLTGFTQYSVDNGIDYTFIGDDISAGFNIQYRGGAIDHNGYHYSIPYAASSIVRTDPRDNSQTFYNVGGLSMSSQKWVDAITAPNKRIYAAPHAATGPLVINTEDPNNVTIDTIGDLTYGLQVRSINIKDNGDGSGVGYMLPYSGSPAVSRFTFQSDGREELTTSVPYTYPIEQDPYYMYRNSQSVGSGFETLAEQDLNFAPFIYRSFWGVVDGGNGKFYGIPYGSSFVMTIDTNNSDAVNFLTDTALSGNAEFSDIAYNQDYLNLRSPQWGKYRGGILASNGCIYSHGTHARAILKINTATDVVEEIPYPQEIIDSMVANQTPTLSASVGRYSASFFDAVGPNGKIYNTIWNSNLQISIDPTDDSIEFESLSAVINEDTTGATTGWYTAPDLDNNTVFIAPGIANSVLQMNFDGYSPSPYSSVTPYTTPDEPTSSPSPSPTGTATPTMTPSNSENYSPPVTESNTPTPTGTPTETPSNTPSISVTASTSKPAVTPSNSPSISKSSTPTPTPSVSPTSRFEKCVNLEYDVEDGPDRFIVTYKNEVIIDTGFIGNIAYKYGNSKRQVFIDALIAEGTDFAGVELALDGYPVVDSTTEGIAHSIVERMNETEAFVTIQSPVHNKPGWKYALNCPIECPTPTPTQTQTPTPTGTATPTPSVSENYVPPVTLSNTPSSTGTPTPSPSVTPSNVPSYSLTQTPTQTGSPTPSATDSPTPSPTTSTTPSNSVTHSQTPSVTRTPNPTPQTPTPTATQTNTPTPSSSVSSSMSNTPTPSLPPETPSGTPVVTPTGTPSGTPSPSTTMTMTASNTPTPSETAPVTTPSGTPATTPTGTPSGTPSPSTTMTMTASNTPTPSETTPVTTPSGTPATTPSSTPSGTPSPSTTMTMTASNTPTPSETAPAVTASNTPPPTPSGTPSGTPPITPSGTGTPTPTSTPSGTPPVTPSTTPSGTPPVTPSGTPQNTPSATPAVTVTPTPSTSFIPVAPPDPT